MPLKIKEIKNIIEEITAPGFPVILEE